MWREQRAGLPGSRLCPDGDTGSDAAVSSVWVNKVFNERRLNNGSKDLLTAQSRPPVAPPPPQLLSPWLFPIRGRPFMCVSLELGSQRWLDWRRGWAAAVSLRRSRLQTGFRVNSLQMWTRLSRGVRVSPIGHDFSFCVAILFCAAINLFQHQFEKNRAGIFSIWLIWQRQICVITEHSFGVWTFKGGILPATISLVAVIQSRRGKIILLLMTSSKTRVSSVIFLNTGFRNRFDCKLSKEKWRLCQTF